MNQPFQPTHEILTPAGEHIQVQLISQKRSVKYRVLTAEDSLDPNNAAYEWHPSEGITYRGIHLEGLIINELNIPANMTHSASKIFASF